MIQSRDSLLHRQGQNMTTPFLWKGVYLSYRE